MDRLYLLRPEGPGLNQPGHQPRASALTVCQYFLTRDPAKAIFFRTEQVALQIIHTLELMAIGKFSSQVPFPGAEM